MSTTPPTQLPPPPPASLDPYLDAAARCFVRFGIRKTSVQDIAAELGVNRVTVYRQAGTVAEVVALLFARDIHRIVGTALACLPTEVGPEDVVDLLAGAVDAVRTHPVFEKVLADDLPWIASLLVGGLPQLLARIIPAVTPILEHATAHGHLAKRDAVVVADQLIRLGISVIASPPAGDLRTYLAELVVPALIP